MNSLATIAAVTLVILCSAANAANDTTPNDDGGMGNNENVVATGGINCYKCSSHPDEQGEACDTLSGLDESLHVVNCPSGMCLKYNQKLGKKDIDQVTRDCAENIEPLLLEKDKTEGCVLSTGTKDVKLQICNCNKDKCNGASEMRSATSLVLAAGLLCVAAKLLH